MAEMPGEGSTDDLAQQMMNVIEQDGHTMLTNYVFIAEGLDPEGRRCMYTTSTDNMSIVTELGLLHYGLNRVNARQAARDTRDWNDE